MGRSSLQTLASMKDEEIERLVHGLSGKMIISQGSLLKKAAYAGAKVALIRPGLCSTWRSTWHVDKRKAF